MASQKLLPKVQFSYYIAFIQFIFAESLTAIVDCLRVALQNCGNDRVKFTTGGQLKRRKSRTHALDIPAGMHRNLSESHLVQAGSKAVSNVAEQFSKIGHSLNPKVLTGKKPPNVANNDESSKALTAENCKVQEEQAAKYVMEPMPTAAETAAEAASKHNNDSFLQSVGIVMVDEAEMAETQHQTEPRKSVNSKNLENVAHISISSVTDNAKFPPEMLDVSEPTNKSNTPEINVQCSDDRGDKENAGNILKMCHSVADMRSSELTYGEDAGAGGSDSVRYGIEMLVRSWQCQLGTLHIPCLIDYSNVYSLSSDRDLKLHLPISQLPHSQSENAIKQLKTLTSPLSKFAANIGSALDPRKYGSKVNINRFFKSSHRKRLWREKYHICQ